jgi:uncharacterized delta-60 repeat protein
MKYRIFAAAAMLCSSIAAAAPGDLLPAFGTGGATDFSIGPSTDHLVKVLAMPDGHTVAVGDASTGTDRFLALARYNADGTPDAGFGNNGKSILREPSEVQAMDALLQPDGKVVVLGLCAAPETASSNVSYPCFFRFNGDGTRDAQFVVDPQPLRSSGWFVRAIALQGDGKIVGALGGSKFPSTPMGIGVVRLTSTGSYDAAFGNAGISRTSDSRGATATAIALQSDGNIVVAGGNGVAPSFTAARFTASGAFDAGYVPSISGEFDVRALAIQPDNSLIAAGCTPSTGRLTVARLTVAGALDNTFGSAGVAQPSSLPNLCANAIALRADGRIAIAGQGSTTFHAVQLTAGGVLDGTFAGGDVAFPAGGTLDTASSVALQAGGKLLVGGDLNARDFAIARLDTNGALEGTFGSAGVTASDMDMGRAGRLVEMRLVNGKTVVLTYLAEPDSRVPGIGELGLARFTAPGFLDPGFAGAGRLLTSLSTTLAAGDTRAIVQSLAVQPDDKILVGGLGRVNGTLSAVVMRLNPDGTPDASFGTAGRKVLFAAMENPNVTPRSGVERIEVLADGRILVAGRNETPPATGCCASTIDPFVTRLLVDGGVDGTFGVAGVARFADTTQTSGDLNARMSLVPLAGGATLLAGHDAHRMAITRLLANGNVDASFGTGGAYIPSTDGNTRSLTVQADGRIAAQGWRSFTFLGVCGNHGIFQRTQFTHTNANGTVDGGTVGGGSLSGDLYGQLAGFWSARLGSDDRFVGAGFGFNGCEPENSGETPGTPPRGRAMVARFTPAGALDTGFGQRGIVALGDNVRTLNYARDVAFTSGAIVVGTQASRVGVPFTLYWLDAGGSPAPSPLPGDIDADGTADGSDANPFVAESDDLAANVTVDVAGSGTVTSSPTNFPCRQSSSSPSCTFHYRDGMPVKLTAGADPGWIFAGWDGACTGLGTCELTASTASTRAVHALFVQDNGAPPDMLAASASSVDFGANSLHTASLARTIHLNNYTPGTVTVTSVSIDDASFAQTNDCTPLATLTSCRIDITFTPPTVGAITGTLAVQTSAGTINVALAGVGEQTLVAHYYQGILGRDADASGKAFWVSEAQRFATLGADPREVYYVMANYFFNSAEYLAANRIDAEFITDLYETFLNRAPDANGFAFWSGQISSGTPRYVVLLSFMFSPEFQAFTTGIFGDATARPEINVVMDLYRGILNRLPDTDAFNFWVGQLRGAQCQGAAAVASAVDSISAQFIFGAEYNGRGRDNTQYVTDLYNAFLRRGAEASGVRFWVSQLDSGAMDRNAVRYQFMGSSEFQGRVNAVAQAGCAQ